MSKRFCIIKTQAQAQAQDKPTTGCRQPSGPPRLKSFVSVLLTSLCLLLASTSVSADSAAPVRIAYVDWSSSVASANVVCAVLAERLDQPCELIETSADEMWRLVADGEADVMLSAWLPDTHASYFAEYGSQLEDLGPNLVGTKTGLVIPATGVGRQTGQRGAHKQPSLDIQSIRQLSEHRQALGGRITGIDPEAGIMAATEKALTAYDLSGFRLIAGTESQMTRTLADAIAAIDRWSSPAGFHTGCSGVGPYAFSMIPRASTAAQAASTPWPAPACRMIIPPRPQCSTVLLGMPRRWNDYWSGPIRTKAETLMRKHCAGSMPTRNGSRPGWTMRNKRRTTDAAGYQPKISRWLSDAGQGQRG